MSYDFPTLDTGQRQKFGSMLDLLAPVDSYYSKIQSGGDEALRRAFAAAQQRIGSQFSPVMRMASARLAGQPLLADSGYANRMNRQIQTAAFGDLSNAYGQASADQAHGQLAALERLIQARMGAGQSLLGMAQKKRGVGGYIGGALGSIGGAALGGFAG